MRYFLLLSTVAAFACGGSNSIQTTSADVSSASSGAVELRSTDTVTNPADFQAWKAGFRNRALANGISANIFDRAFAGVGLNSKVINLDNNQAEFTKTAAQYIDGALNSIRVNSGLQMRSKHDNTLSQIKSRLGVDAGVVMGIWGMESNYGKNYGNIPIAEALGSLAYDGRRRQFAETQLMTALRLMQKGEVPPERMIGSWAGALGHTQFIPTSYDSLAIDFSGDGRRDLWDVTDALGSTGNYLAKNGWVNGAPWGLEVNVPSNVTMGEKNIRSVVDWNAAGVTLARGGAIPNHGSGALIAPSGLSGPKFIVFKNFRVIKTYNNSTNYALAVGLLGDKVMGKPGLTKQWPIGAGNLRSAQVLELQKALSRKGYDIEKIDGIMGPQTRDAMNAYASKTASLAGADDVAIYNSLK